MLVNGVDIIEIDRIRRVAEQYGLRFLGRIYTEGEIAYCRGRAPQMASPVRRERGGNEGAGHGDAWS